MTLRDGKPGQVVRIESIQEFPLKERLMTMGFIEGTRVNVLRTAPMGDPIVYGLRGYNVAMRLDDASHISVSLVNE